VAAASVAALVGGMGTGARPNIGGGLFAGARAYAAGTGSRSEQEMAARQAITAAYNDLNDALMRRDVADLFAHYAPDYVSVNQDGRRMNLPRLRERVVSLLRNVESAKAITKIQKFYVQNDMAFCEIKEGARFLFVHPKTRKTTLMRVRSTSRDRWVRRGGRWLLAQSRTLQATTTLDGKPVAAK
jgi:hypothetical protein